MKLILLSIFLLMIISAGQTQDFVYKKDGTSFYCKIREITVDVIKYKRTDIKSSPIFEIKKNDVYKICYKHGAIDILDPVFYKMKTDTMKYAMVYIVYNSNQSSEEFPLSVNHRSICKFKDRSRLALKILSEGEFTFAWETMYNVGPERKLVAVNGQTYAIFIKVINEKARPLNDKYSITIYEGSEEVQNFIAKEYNGFTPQKDLDFHEELK